MKPLLHRNEWEEVQSRMSKASSEKKVRRGSEIGAFLREKFARLCRRDTGRVITPQLHTHVHTYTCVEKEGNYTKSRKLN